MLKKNKNYLRDWYELCVFQVSALKNGILRNCERNDYISLGKKKWTNEWMS